MGSENAPRTLFRLGGYNGMSTVEKVKIGLNECRMLGLGAQVLIGFQFQGVFQPRFSKLPTSSHIAQIGGLVLLLARLGALIVPSTQPGSSTRFYGRLTEAHWARPIATALALPAPTIR